MPPAPAAIDTRGLRPSVPPPRRRLLRERRWCARLGLARAELHRARARHRDHEVEAVDERAGELVAVPREPLGRARALCGRIPARAAWAHVHRSEALSCSPLEIEVFRSICSCST